MGFRLEKDDLAQFHPDLHERLQPLALYNSRSPRPGEKDGEDHHFRRREEIENLREKGEFRAFYFPLGDAGKTLDTLWLCCEATKPMRLSRGRRTSSTN